MDKQFKLSNTKQPLTAYCVSQNIYNFDMLCKIVSKLPYGRNTNRNDYTLLFKENKGTCSTKHAFLKQVAIENQFHELQLCIGIYKMTATNTKGIASVLNYYKLDYIPEAHTYLKMHNQIYDFTKPGAGSNAFASHLLSEEYIQPQDIGCYKLKVHQMFLKQWLKKVKISYDFESLWVIREACIKALCQS